MKVIFVFLLLSLFLINFLVLCSPDIEVRTRKDIAEIKHRHKDVDMEYPRLRKVGRRRRPKTTTTTNSPITSTTPDQEDDILTIPEGLDISCLVGKNGPVPPPVVENAHPRLKKINGVLAAEYACIPRFKIVDENATKVFCKLRKWYGIRPQCIEKENCSKNNGGCDHLCRLDKLYDIECYCEKGYQVNPNEKHSCVDIDECELGTYNCQHICENTLGSYICACNHGYALSSDQKSCEDVNECIDGDVPNFGCSHTCINVPGSAFCKCPSGYELDSDAKTCVDIDECAKDRLGSVCPHGCINTIGSFTCKEEPLKTLVSPVSSDLKQGKKITNTDGKNYYDVDGSGDDDEDYEGSGDDENDYDVEVSYKETPTTPKIIIATTPLISTTTTDEIENEYDTIDIDETQTDNIDETENKENDINIEISTHKYREQITTSIPEPDEEDDYEVEQSSGEQPKCMKGYEKTNGVCQDINECKSIRPMPCDQICKNNKGSFSCSCLPGYELLSDKKTCVDIDECQNNNALCSHDCVNTIGSYECKCPNTFVLSADGYKCISPREETTTSRNNNRACPIGFTITKNYICIDQDECVDNNGGCSHECINTQGSYRCVCPDELTLGSDRHSCEYESTTHGGSGDESTESNEYGDRCATGYDRIDDDEDCRDIDECVEYSPCLHNCHNIPGSYFCTCREGYELLSDKRTCVDVDECHRDSTLCSHHCYNTHGSYECACPYPLVVSDDKHTCIDDNTIKTTTYGIDDYYSTTRSPVLLPGLDPDQCMINNGGCSHLCADIDGEIKCACPEKYILLENDDKTCIEIDDCSVNNGGCSHICHNGSTATYCSCPTGYYLDPIERTNCYDIDECKFNNGGCSHTCINFIDGKGYTCSCPKNMKLDKSEKECRLSCEYNNGGCSHTCEADTEEEGVICSCPNGYKLINHKTCEDINECLLSTCSHDCTNSEGSYQCICPIGYQLSNINQNQCVDLDECEDNSHGCTHYCKNTIGNYECFCPKGYNLSTIDHKTCEDVNECEINNGDCSDYCENTEGSFICRCPSGFMINENDNITCIDIDECKHHNGNCIHQCINTIGSYHCGCPSGYEIINGQCKDINECLINNGNCQHICVNTIGNYHCKCTSGYNLTDDGKCNDINECKEGISNCEQDCRNTIGSYYCRCKHGYRLSYDRKTCRDVDECKILSINRCEQICENTPGSYHCRCRNGYKLSDDKKSCIDINECEDSSSNCPNECINTEGSYKCTCKDGFRLSSDGNTCIDINECDEGIINCDQNCINTNGSFICTCARGLKIVNTTTCIDINECDHNNGGCEHECVNSFGSHHCKCFSGYIQDRWDSSKCQDHNECDVNNGRCEHNCINTRGSYHCECNTLYVLSQNKHSCIKTENDILTVETVRCPPMNVRPEIKVICPRLGHLSSYPIGATCNLKCPTGKRVEGLFKRTCESDGTWSGGEVNPECVTSRCGAVPKLTSPGRYLIQQGFCDVYNNSATSQPGDYCIITCPRRFSLPKGHSAIVMCSQEGVWKPNHPPPCIPYKGIPKPFIQCPQDMTVKLKPSESKAIVNLDRPKSNMDWNRYVIVDPPSAKNLHFNLVPGKHLFSFTAMNPWRNISESCRVYITVLDEEPPTVHNCPQDITVSTKNSMEIVYWVEPTFTDNVQILGTHKSSKPGTLFKEGSHRIVYSAWDTARNKKECSFNINIRNIRQQLYGSNKAHEDGKTKYFTQARSFNTNIIICNGRRVQQVNPWIVPTGCYKPSSVTHQYGPRVANIPIPSSTAVTNRFKFYNQWNAIHDHTHHTKQFVKLCCNCYNTGYNLSLATYCGIDTHKQCCQWICKLPH